MSFIKHNCNQCGEDLVFPEQLLEIRCPGCGSHFLVEIFEQLVALKKIKHTENQESKQKSPSTSLSYKSEGEQIKLLDKRIQLLLHQLVHERSSAFSSLSVSFLFFFFTLVWCWAGRFFLGIFCGTITTAMTLIAMVALKNSARMRNSLNTLVFQREEIMRQLSANIPKIF